VKWNVQEATGRIRALEEYRLHWIEEPLPPHDLKAHAHRRNAVSTRVGTGEQEWTPEAHRRVIAAGAVDVVQMDPGCCLGITGCRKVIDLIELENLAFSMYSWSSAINTAASLHLMASSSQVENWFPIRGFIRTAGCTFRISLASELPLMKRLPRNI
jgi:L-alanine-DL-glutamate epimerase-like enolase superfamily enzyme